MSMNFFDFSDPFDVFFAVFYGIYLLGVLAAIVVFYVLQAKGLYAIAKRRGIHHPGLAWVPIGNWWIIGCISDQYQYVTNGRIRNRRKTLTRLSIAIFSVAVVLIGMCVLLVVGIIESGAEDLTPVMGMISWYIFYLGFMGLCVVGSVFCYIASFDLFRSCNPKTAVLFLVLSIVVCPMSIFIFVDRKYDYGMPPRRMTTEPILPKPEPEPVYNEADPMAEEDDFA